MTTATMSPLLASPKTKTASLVEENENGENFWFYKKNKDFLATLYFLNFPEPRFKLKKIQLFFKMSLNSCCVLLKQG